MDQVSVEGFSFIFKQYRENQQIIKPQTILNFKPTNPLINLSNPSQISPNPQIDQIKKLIIDSSMFLTDEHIVQQLKKSFTSIQITFISIYIQYTMHLFNKFKTYLQPSQKQQPTHPEKPSVESSASSLRKSLEKSAESYQLIMLDILENSELDSSAKREHKKSQEIYQDLVYQVVEEEEEHQGIQNMYLKDFIFVNKLEEARELTVEEWNQMVDKRNLSLYPKKNIYFSILKGIKFQVRKKVWQLFANTQQLKKMTTRPYKQLIHPSSIRPEILSQIEKDVPRSKSVTSYLKELKNILIGYCALTKKEYTQGMNLIAGSLLTLLALENDEELGVFSIYEKMFEERVFWIFIGVMVWKNWQDIFDANFLGLTKRLQILQTLMAEHVPSIYQKLIDFEWDLTIFSQYYITIMLYNTPTQFSKIILDLFFLDGENALHSLIIRMMKLQEERILGFSDQCQLMGYFKKDMIVDCWGTVRRNQGKARRLEDFQMNFLRATKN